MPGNGNLADSRMNCYILVISSHLVLAQPNSLHERTQTTAEVADIHAVKHCGPERWNFVSGARARLGIAFRTEVTSLYWSVRRHVQGFSNAHRYCSPSNDSSPVGAAFSRSQTFPDQPHPSKIPSGCLRQHPRVLGWPPPACYHHGYDHMPSRTHARCLRQDDT